MSNANELLVAIIIPTDAEKLAGSDKNEYSQWKVVSSSVHI